ncbi:YciI family protein [Roseomonas marmotae]|uniref:YciI family protein n=1 Tax=Roseomonas marmotae TaxID=2768161 RepID=A0ABS3KFX9_9PROT|nr:YciI family protein [Roseomonas marmotae]MBO1076373.1 YciI family protein [Roseomonas marmotae]QTI79417.1 YciI family protein [Roseomonas marmotae]
MPYMIETWDKPESQSLRLEHRAAHLAYLAENAARLLACGAKLADDGGDGGGSFYIVDVETREEAESFLAADPFTQAGLPGRQAITRWRKAYLDGKSYLPKN